MLLQQVFKFGIARVVPAAFAFAGLAWFTRVLPPESYGLYVVLIAAGTATHATAMRWLDLSLLRLWSTWEQRQRIAQRTVFLVFWVAIVPAIVAGIVVARHSASAQMDSHLLVIFSVYLVAFSVVEILLAIATAESRVRDYGIALTIRAAVLLLLGAWLTLKYPSAVVLLVANTAGQCLGAFFLLTRRRVPVVPAARGDAAIAKDLLGFGLPLAASFALAAIVAVSDRLLLARLSSIADAGTYSAAYDLAAQAILLSGIIVNLAAYPWLMRQIEARGVNACRQEMIRHFVVLVGILLVVAWPFVFSPGLIAGVVLGAEYRAQAIDLLPLIAGIGLMAAVKAYYFDLAFHIARRTGMLIALNACVAVLNIILNIMFIPRWGAAGAAVATAVAYFAGTMLSLIAGSWIRLRMPLPLSPSLRLAAAVVPAGLAHFGIASSTLIGRDYLALAIGIAVLLAGFAVGGLIGLAKPPVRDAMVPE